MFSNNSTSSRKILGAHTRLRWTMNTPHVKKMQVGTTKIEQACLIINTYFFTLDIKTVLLLKIIDTGRGFNSSSSQLDIYHCWAQSSSENVSIFSNRASVGWDFLLPSCPDNKGRVNTPCVNYGMLISSRVRDSSKLLVNFETYLISHMCLKNSDVRAVA